MKKIAFGCLVGSLLFSPVMTPIAAAKVPPFTVGPKDTVRFAGVRTDWSLFALYCSAGSYYYSSKYTVYLFVDYRFYDPATKAVKNIRYDVQTMVNVPRSSLGASVFIKVPLPLPNENDLNKALGEPLTSKYYLTDVVFTMCPNNSYRLINKFPASYSMTIEEYVNNRKGIIAAGWPKNYDWDQSDDTTSGNAGPLLPTDDDDG